MSGGLNALADSLTPVLLEAIRRCDLEENVRYFHASTYHIYGNPQEIPQSELTPFNPSSARDESDAIFNHESPQQDHGFVSRKITSSVARISLHQQESLEFGNLNSRRDWGYTRDHIEAMWLMLQRTPNDYVIATGQTHSVRQFVEQSFLQIGTRIIWDGDGVNEVGKEQGSNIVRVTINPMLYRSDDMSDLIGNPEKAKNDLQWSPTTSFEEIAKEMVIGDLDILHRSTLQ